MSRSRQQPGRLELGTPTDERACRQRRQGAARARDRAPARDRASARERLCARPARAWADRLVVFGCRVLPSAALGTGRALARCRDLPPFCLHDQVPGRNRSRHDAPLRRHPRLATAPPLSQQARADLEQNRVGWPLVSPHPNPPPHAREGRRGRRLGRAVGEEEAYGTRAEGTKGTYHRRVPRHRPRLRRSRRRRDEPARRALISEGGMELGLRGRKALVTGASKGIGRACAEVLAEEGCDVVLVSRTTADLEATRAAIVAKHNVAVRYYPLDLSDSRNVDKLADECSETDLLVNNAGAIPGGDIAQIDEARWRTAWDLKVFGYVNMTRRFYALMAQRKKGVIINILGAAGENPDFDYIAGSSGNASLMAFTRAMGGTAPRDGLRVVGINPGPVMTDRLVTLMRTRAQTQFGDAERWTEFMKPLAFGRAARPEEIAWMAAFLASDLSAYTTGSIVTIDGGGSSRRSAL